MQRWGDCFGREERLSIVPRRKEAYRKNCSKDLAVKIHGEEV